MSKLALAAIAPALRPTRIREHPGWNVESRCDKHADSEYRCAGGDAATDSREVNHPHSANRHEAHTGPADLEYSNVPFHLLSFLWLESRIFGYTKEAASFRKRLRRKVPVFRDYLPQDNFHEQRREHLGARDARRHAVIVCGRDEETHGMYLTHVQVRDVKRNLVWVLRERDGRLRVLERWP